MAKPQKKRPARNFVGTLGWVTFESYGTKNTYRFTALLGDSSPSPTDGYGGWNTVARKRRRSVTQWDGNNPLTMPIAVLLVGFAADASVESQIRQLEKMAGLEAGMSQPPYVAFDSGGVIPHDASSAPQLDWVISSIEWGDADRRLSDGDRTRQAATITVMQAVEDDLLSGASSAQRRRAKKHRQQVRGRAQRGAKSKKYVVRDRESLESIAAKPISKGGLGRASRWHELKKLNPRWRDPKRILPIGTVLNLP